MIAYWKKTIIIVVTKVVWGLGLLISLEQFMINLC